MRALQFEQYGPPHVLTVGEIPEPHAGPGEIRIAVRASGLTPADTYLRSGRFRDWMPLSLPHVLGVDASGSVDEIGAGVTGTSLGDEVFGFIDIARHGGANAEYAVLSAWEAKPAALSWVESGGLAANAETSQRMLDQLDVVAGETLLIEGASGGVGLLATQFALARGATVIGTAGPGSHAILRELGAVPVTYGPGLADRLPRAVDAVLDVSGRGSLAELVQLAGGPGRVVTIADLERHAELGVKLSRSGGPGADPAAVDGLRTAADLAHEGRLRRLIGAVFRLDEGEKAHALSETGHPGGKIILVP